MSTLITTVCCEKIVFSDTNSKAKGEHALSGMRDEVELIL